MTQHYDGVERREGPDMMQLASDLKNGLREIRATQRLMAQDISCLKEEFKAHQPLLSELASREERWRDLKSAVLTKSLVAIAWALIVLLGISVWDYLVKMLGR